MRTPRKLNESSFHGPFRTLAQAFNDVLELSEANKLVSVIGGRFTRTTLGTSLEIKPGEGIQNVRLFTALVKTIKRDYLLCKECSIKSNGTVTESGSGITVAKPFELQFWLRTQTTGDYTWIQVPSDPVPMSRDWKSTTRTIYANESKALVGETVETDDPVVYYNQEIWTPYVEGKTIILVADVDGQTFLNLPSEVISTDPPVNYPALTSSMIDLNVAGRCWQDSHRELRICDSATGQVQYIMHRASQNYVHQ